VNRTASVENGRVVFGAWKHVRRYDAVAQGRLGATTLAGKAGDVLGRLRMLPRSGSPHGQKPASCSGLEALCPAVLPGDEEAQPANYDQTASGR